MKQKVFVIGFQKTGTTSLELALESLGYRVYGGDKNILKFDDDKTLKTYILNLLKSWDAVQDMPWPLVYKQLYELYPDAKFILTIRNTDKWIKSVVQYFASIRVPLHREIYNVPCAEGYEETYTSVYNIHNRDVQGFFKGKENFLVMQTEKNFNFKTLCSFLGIESPPEENFPHGRNNGKRVLPNYKLYRDIRSLYWNLKKKY